MNNMAYISSVITIILALSFPLLMSLRVYYLQADYVCVLYIPIYRIDSTAVSGLVHLQVDEVVRQEPT
jgi:hypothetical protein